MNKERNAVQRAFCLEPGGNGSKQAHGVVAARWQCWPLRRVLRLALHLFRLIRTPKLNVNTPYNRNIEFFSIFKLQKIGDTV